MKVVIAGASGSGKTTLAKSLASHFNWEFTENSAGLIMSNEDKMYLKERYGYHGDWGQRAVINISHKEPGFGKFFQEAILRARYRIGERNADAIYDRSALDPIVFYLNQVVHNEVQDDSEHFIHKCIGGLRHVNLIIRLPLQNPQKTIENNGSRVDNWYFQRKIDYLFSLAIDLVKEEANANRYLLEHHKLSVATCPTWDWNDRFQWAVKQVQRLIEG